MKKRSVSKNLKDSVIKQGRLKLVVLVLNNHQNKILAFSGCTELNFT